MTPGGSTEEIIKNKFSVIFYTFQAFFSRNGLVSDMSTKYFSNIIGGPQAVYVNIKRKLRPKHFGRVKNITYNFDVTSNQTISISCLFDMIYSYTYTNLNFRQVIRRTENMLV